MTYRRDIKTEYDKIRLQFVSISSSLKTPLPIQPYDDLIYHGEKERSVDTSVVKTVQVHIINKEKLQYRENILQTIHRPYKPILYNDPNNPCSLNRISLYLLNINRFCKLFSSKLITSCD